MLKLHEASPRAQRVAPFDFPQKSVSARAGINIRKMPKRKIEDSDDDVPVFGPETEKIAVKKAGINIWKMPKQRIEDSDDDVPVYGPEAEKIAVKKARLEDSDDEVPLFGPNGQAEKILQPEEEQESQQPLAPEDYLKQEVAGWPQEDLNAEAVDEAEARLGIAESMASTPSKNKFEVSRSFQDDDVVRMAAAKMTRFEGKGTLKITK